MLELLRYLPKNYLSACFGFLLSLALPQSLVRSMIKFYIRIFDVQMHEVLEPPNGFRSLGEFFSRTLKPGSRPLGEGVVSPCDGKIEQCGEAVKGELIQAKGLGYSVRDLIADDDLAQHFEGGYYLTIYLSPKDYHHVHSPVSGKISEMLHLPGMLWPVNHESVARVEKLFAVNERIVTLIDTTQFGKVAVVKVGATNVGSIRLAYDNFAANKGLLRGLFSPRSMTRRRYFPQKEISRGDKLAVFELGSTVILLFEPRRFVCSLGPRREIRCGESIGTGFGG